MRLIGRWRARRAGRGRGQALVEFALVFPLLMLLVLTVVVLGIYVFYNQQIENAAREAARYAAIHSHSSQCPTVSRVDPQVEHIDSYYRCDPPELGWPEMTKAARSNVWGMPSNQVTLAACWSGYVDALNNYDALPVAPNVFTNCTIDTIDPRTSAGLIACPAPATRPSATPGTPKADGDDKASAIAAAVGNNLAYPTTVTVYACYRWTPPLSGFLFVPSQITIRAVVTEALQRQQ